MIDTNQARDRLEDILHSREYQVYYEDNRNVLQRWWDSVVEWFEDLLVKIFGSLEPSNEFATGVVIIIGLVVVVLLILAIIYVTRYFSSKRRYNSQSPFQKHEKDWTYIDHLTEATNQEQAGNIASATRHLFIALLLYFHKKGYLEAKIWKTNWEYFEELQALDKKRANDFHHLAKIFEEVVYGEQTLGQESYIEYKEAIMYWTRELEHEEKLEG